MSYRTDIESQSQFDSQMSRPAKRARTEASYASRSGVKRAWIPRAPRSKGASSLIRADNRCIIPLTASIDITLTADWAKTFSFSPEGLYINGSLYAAYPGMTEVAAVFEMVRLTKVEMTILPAANVLDYNNQTVGTGVTNIPYVYTAADYNDETTPTLNELQQNPTLKLSRFDKVFRRTFYPRLAGNTTLIDLGQNQKNIFLKTGETSSQKWHGIKVFIDMVTNVWTYGGGRCLFKCYFECVQSK